MIRIGCGIEEERRGKTLEEVPSGIIGSLRCEIQEEMILGDSSRRVMGKEGSKVVDTLDMFSISRWK